MITPQQRNAWRGAYLRELRKIAQTPRPNDWVLTTDWDNALEAHLALFSFCDTVRIFKVLECILKNHPVALFLFVYYQLLFIFATGMQDFRIPEVFEENERYETQNHRLIGICTFVCLRKNGSAEAEGRSGHLYGGPSEREWRTPNRNEAVCPGSDPHPSLVCER